MNSRRAERDRDQEQGWDHVDFVVDALLSEGNSGSPVLAASCKSRELELVGVYHAGYSLANRTLDVVFIWLGAAGGPALIMALERGGPKAMREAAREQAAFMLLLTVPAAVGLAMVARPLAELLVGPELRVGAAQVTPWIAASGFLGGFTTYYFSQAFTLSRRTQTQIPSQKVLQGFHAKCRQRRLVTTERVDSCDTNVFGQLRRVGHPLRENYSYDKTDSLEFKRPA